jgi:hypothetical protein
MLEFELKNRDIEINSLRRRIARMREETDTADKRYT